MIFDFILDLADFLNIIWGLSSIWKFIFSASYRKKTKEEFHSDKLSDKVIVILKIFISALFNLLIIGLLVYLFSF